MSSWKYYETQNQFDPKWQMTSFQYWQSRQYWRIESEWRQSAQNFPKNFEEPKIETKSASNSSLNFNFKMGFHFNLGKIPILLHQYYTNYLHNTSNRSIALMDFLLSIEQSTPFNAKVHSKSHPMILIIQGWTFEWKFVKNCPFWAISKRVFLTSTMITNLPVGDKSISAQSTSPTSTIPWLTDILWCRSCCLVFLAKVWAIAPTLASFETEAKLRDTKWHWSQDNDRHELWPFRRRGQVWVGSVSCKVEDITTTESKV